MTSRDRVLSSLSHREPDRVPLDLGATKVTGIHRTACARLRTALALPEREVVVHDRVQQLARVDADLQDALGVDVEGVWPQFPPDWDPNDREDAEYRYYTDEWGIVRRTPKDGGRYYDICRPPFSGEISAEALDRYPWPDPIEPARFTEMRREAEAARSRGRAVVLGGISAGMLEMSLNLRGFEDFFADLGADLPLARKLFDRILSTKMAYWERALSECGEFVDVVFEADDLGSQNGLLISPRLYRQELKPRQRELFSHIKSLAPVRIFFHTCGSVISILPDLIEAGIDILNPVQVSAAGMDTARLKAEFGGDLTFWGGGVDSQRTLPFGTPDQVRDEVGRRMADLKSDGGFVFNPVHNIQADVPAENMLAMFEAYRAHWGP